MTGIAKVQQRQHLDRMPAASKRQRVRLQVFVACLALCQGLALAAGPPPASPGPAPDAASAVRLRAMADQLIGFLNQAVALIDTPSSHVPLADVRPQIQAAMLAHPEVQLASTQQLIAGFASREAYAGFLPQVSANIDAGLRSYDPVNKPWNVVPAHQDNAQSVALTVRQMLYDFGAVAGRVDAQRARQSAASARLDAKRSELVLRAVTAWHEVFRTRQQARLAEVNRLSRQQILNFIEERERLGGSAKSDVLRAQARLSDAQATLVAAQNRLHAAEASYRETFGLAPAPDLGLPALVAVDLAGDVDADALILRNASYAEGLAQSLAAGHDARSAAAALLPTLSLEAVATRRDIGSGATPGLDKTIGLVLRQNFYTGGADTARKNQADQRTVEAHLALDNLRRQLARAIGQTLADARSADSLITARKEAVQLAAAAFESVREQFAYRRGTLLDLLRAQEDLDLAGRELIDGVVDRALARYRLLHLSMDLTPLFDPGAPVAPPDKVAQ